ncbi:MAG: hypothetical protein OXF02_08185 [Simkaniaceae bacterium]|nr:hypothetical protein [Simkaniaceae bacterium]
MAGFPERGRRPFSGWGSVLFFGSVGCLSEQVTRSVRRLSCNQGFDTIPHRNLDML